MTDASVEKNRSVTGGITGEQPDFLRDCGVIALLGVLGQHGITEAQRGTPHACSPERSHGRRESKLPENSGESAVLSRSIRESESTLFRRGVDWAADAMRVINHLPDEATRCVLIDSYHESAAFIEFEQNRSREDAEQQAFGLLLFQILRLGIDVGVMP
jgi:hypothetical protein